MVLSVSFQTALASLSAPVQYAELARTLGVKVGQRVEARQVRSAVRELRASKGMVLNDADHDTWSAGSFFTNPIVAERSVPHGAPQFEVEEPGLRKTSAAWLISHAGFDKGFTLDGQAGLSTKHSLALTNRGGASAQGLVELARHVRGVVEEKFGITLVPEPVLVGLEL